MHDFKALSIKFAMPRPDDPSKQTQVLVSLAHVVRMVPCYFVESGGARMVTTVEGDGDTGTRGQGLTRTFTVYDDLGGRYDSGSATRAGQALLEQMWRESA
jgi:hypothetical protein